MHLQKMHHFEHSDFDQRPALLQLHSLPQVSPVVAALDHRLAQLHARQLRSDDIARRADQRVDATRSNRAAQTAALIDAATSQRREREIAAARKRDILRRAARATLNQLEQKAGFAETDAATGKTKLSPRRSPTSMHDGTVATATTTTSPRVGHDRELVSWPRGVVYQQHPSCVVQRTAVAPSGIAGVLAAPAQGGTSTPPTMMVHQAMQVAARFALTGSSVPAAASSTL